jgi:hypothetical protein
MISNNLTPDKYSIATDFSRLIPFVFLLSLRTISRLLKLVAEKKRKYTEQLIFSEHWHLLSTDQKEQSNYADTFCRRGFSRDNRA